MSIGVKCVYGTQWWVERRDLARISLTSKRTLRNERDDYESVIGCTGKVLVPTYSSHSTTCTQQGAGVSVGYRGRVWSGGWFVSILRTVPWIWKYGRPTLVCHVCGDCATHRHTSVRKRTLAVCGATIWRVWWGEHTLRIRLLRVSAILVFWPM